MPLYRWHGAVDAAGLTCTAAVKALFGSADQVGPADPSHNVYVLRVMTHREHDTQPWPADCGCYNPEPEGSRRPLSRTPPGPCAGPQLIPRYYDLVREFPLPGIADDAHLYAAEVVMHRLLRARLDAGGEVYLDTLSDLVIVYEREHQPHRPAAAFCLARVGA